MMNSIQHSNSFRAASLLGAEKTLRELPNTAMDWIYLIREGFPTTALDALGSNIGVTNAELAQMLGISVRALAGRRRKKILSPYESERLLRIAYVIAHAEDVFGNLTTGFAWLTNTNISLGRFTPMSLLDTQIGAELVTNVLARIEYGIVV